MSIESRIKKLEDARAITRGPTGITVVKVAAGERFRDYVGPGEIVLWGERVVMVLGHGMSMSDLDPQPAERNL